MRLDNNKDVIPAKAGIHHAAERDSRFRGNDDEWAVMMFLTIAQDYFSYQAQGDVHA